MVTGKPSTKECYLPRLINFKKKLCKLVHLKIVVFLHSAFKNKRSVRLGVRTPGFHPGNRGSIPLRTTNLNKKYMANHKSALKRIRNSEVESVYESLSA